MRDGRSGPDELRAHARDEEARPSRGKLTIFFGAAPGVGKTYTMLEAARAEVEDQKRDVVIGLVETHGRYDTGSLLIGLELLPRRPNQHRGVEVEELDLDAALARKPELILIDELAHTNAPGARHLKRWQDVDELLDAGVDVFTTLNVQHLESLNDVVAQIAGVFVRETVPDSVFDKAYEVRLVDLPVDLLLERLAEGKIYVPHQAARALDGFFREGNLIALRELALRRTAERVEAKMRGYKVAHGIEESWHAGERVLVCVSPSPTGPRLVRAARRMATSLHAELVGVYVETPGSLRMTAGDRERVAQTLRLVESLGGEAVTVRGEDAPAETVSYARKRNVTKIVVGKPTHPRWRDVLRPSFLDRLVRQSREIDVYVISGELGEKVPLGPSESPARAPLGWRGYGAGLTITGVAALVAWVAFGRRELADVAMTLLLGVVLVSMRFGYGPSLVAAVVSVVVFDFFFVPPYMSFAVADFGHLVTFGVMFLVAVVISGLTKRIRDQADAARSREHRTASLFTLTRELNGAITRDALLEAAARHVREVFGGRVVVFLPGPGGALEVGGRLGSGGDRCHGNDPDVPSADARVASPSPGHPDRGVVDWVWNHEKPAGVGTDTLPAARGLFVPLRAARRRVGVMGLFDGHARWGLPDERQLLHTIAGLIGAALERTEMAEEARRAALRIETEQLRNALLSSVSHDLRTPLGVVTGATSALLEDPGPRDEATRRELLRTAHGESLRLNRLVGNLLDMTRLEAGALKVQKEPQPLEEVIGAALNRLEDRLKDRDIATHLADDLALVPLDPVLVEQVLINLIENVTKYTPPGSPIEIAARAIGGEVRVEVNDRGPGVPPADAERVFDKFYRAKEVEGGGVGLGLTICRGIVTAHGGRMWVEPRDGGGASFRFTLPLEADLHSDIGAIQTMTPF
jgi:two-component system, OmpR family, sensor histidine kinase KdpD